MATWGYTRSKYLNMAIRRSGDGVNLDSGPKRPDNTKAEHGLQGCIPPPPSALSYKGWCVQAWRGIGVGSRTGEDCPQMHPQPEQPTSGSPRLLFGHLRSFPAHVVPDRRQRSGSKACHLPVQHIPTQHCTVLRGDGAKCSYEGLVRRIGVVEF